MNLSFNGLSSYLTTPRHPFSWGFYTPTTIQMLQWLTVRPHHHEDRQLPRGRHVAEGEANLAELKENFDVIWSEWRPHIGRGALGWDHCVATPALLCQKNTAPGAQSPLSAPTLISWLVLMTEDITSVGVITLDDTRGSLSEGWDLRIQLYDFPDCYCLVYSNFDWAHFECQ